MKLDKLLSKLSIKVGLVVTLLFLLLLVLFNFLVISQGERAFETAIESFQKQGFIEFQGPTRWRHITLTPVDPETALPYDAETGEPIYPAERFAKNFQASLWLLGVIGVVGAFTIGWFTSRMVTRPLNKVNRGMNKLRKNDYRQKLEHTDTEEFNALIDEFNRLAAELHRVEELRKDLISDTSHELKTPVASLMAQLEGIRDGIIKADDERVQSLNEQVQRLHELVETLHEYSNLRSKSIKPEIQNIRLIDITHSLQSQFSDQLKSANVRLETSFAEDTTISADKKLITQVLSNLVANTLRYAQAHTISISANKDTITFSDNGVGIPEQHLRDVFERFFRLEKSRSRATGGLGLGLAIVREIVEAHGWTIHAEKPSQGTGVTFVLSMKKT